MKLLSRLGTILVSKIVEYPTMPVRQEVLCRTDESRRVGWLIENIEGVSVVNAPTPHDTPEQEQQNRLASYDYDITKLQIWPPGTWTGRLFKTNPNESETDK